jgi:DNA-binding IclR family transcriptional regulator
VTQQEAIRKNSLVAIRMDVLQYRMMTKDPPEQALIASVLRAAEILRLVAAGHRELRVKQVADALGLQRSTAYRYLASLSTAGLLSRNAADATYVIGPLLVELAATTLSHADLIEVAGPLMHRLAEDVQETVTLSLWDGTQPVIVQVVMDTSRLLHVAVRPGGSLPLESAQGQVFLAYMTPESTRDRVLHHLRAEVRDQVRRQMPVVSDTGLATFTRATEGTRSIAAPILDSRRRVIATVALVGTTARVSADRSSRMASALLATANNISRRFGASG